MRNKRTESNGMISLQLTKYVPAELLALKCRITDLKWRQHDGKCVRN